MAASNRGNRRRSGPEHPVSPVAFRGFIPILVRVLAALGLGVSAYLTYLYYSESTAALCTEGSGCDIVRSSSYSIILGIPIALLGVAGFALILAVSFSRLSPFRKGISLYLLALAGVTFSAYLTYLEIAVIDAICPYCIVSASLMTGILLLLLLQRPLVPGLSRSSLRLYSGLLVAAVVLVSLVGFGDTGDTGDGNTATAYQVALAQHLTAEGAVMYGAYWCPHCADQKKLFGSAFAYVNYVECAADGKDAKPALCRAKGIKGYPTWEISGKLYEGVFPLAELARLTGYSG